VTRQRNTTTVRCDLPDACPVAVACAVTVGGRAPCLDMWQAHDRKLKLCQAIEAIADGLPSAVDRLQCLQVANQLVPLLRETHRYEEENVFPVFERAGGRDALATAASIRRLKAEHVEDECAAQDLTEVLLEIGHGGTIQNPEALGFMLRAFFEPIRRHIAFEREHVVPVVARRSAN
jgi:hemerythrin-like domain-containing protein